MDEDDYEYDSSESEDWIVCPYCKSDLDDSHEYFYKHDDEESTEIECPSCDEKFMAKLQYTYKYHSHKREEE